jgi:hypothetical protein
MAAKAGPLINYLDVHAGQFQSAQFSGITRFQFFNNTAPENIKSIREKILPRYPNLAREARGKINHTSITLFVSENQENVMQEVKAFARECLSPHDPEQLRGNWFRTGAVYSPDYGFLFPVFRRFTDKEWSEGMHNRIISEPSNLRSAM